MEQSAIFGPFLTVMALTLLVWIYMYARRIRFLTREQVDPQTLTAARLAEISPPAVANPSDNLKNLFEIPVLFYALCLYLYVTEQVDTTYLVAAWVFAGFRVLHSLMHCTANVVMVRFWLYAISTLALWSMLIRATLHHFAS